MKSYVPIGFHSWWNDETDYEIFGDILSQKFILPEFQSLDGMYYLVLFRHQELEQRLNEEIQQLFGSVLGTSDTKNIK